MRIREHKGFGHGLPPGSGEDINCLSCQQEREAGVKPVITESSSGKPVRGPLFAGKERDTDWQVVIAGTPAPDPARDLVVTVRVQAGDEIDEIDAVFRAGMLFAAEQAQRLSNRRRRGTGWFVTATRSRKEHHDEAGPAEEDAAR